MCYSHGLAEFLRRRVEKLPKRQRPDYVGTFHYLGIGWGVPEGSDDDSRYWEEFLPARMVSLAGDLPASERFDAIVVDEGQCFAARLARAREMLYVGPSRASDLLVVCGDLA